MNCLNPYTDEVMAILIFQEVKGLTIDVYAKILEAVNEMFGSYRKWKEDYKKYLQNKKGSNPR